MSTRDCFGCLGMAPLNIGALGGWSSLSALQIHTPDHEFFIQSWIIKNSWSAVAFHEKWIERGVLCKTEVCIIHVSGLKIIMHENVLAHIVARAIVSVHESEFIWPNAPTCSMDPFPSSQSNLLVDTFTGALKYKPKFCYSNKRNRKLDCLFLLKQESWCMFEEFGTIVYLAKPLGRWYFKPGQVHSQIAYCLARIKKPKLKLYNNWFCSTV